jgi:hypothetical protein
MAKAATAAPDSGNDGKPDETVKETPPPDDKKDPPQEPPPDDKSLENQNEGKRKSLWTDAVAALSRRVKILEEREIAGTVWTIPAILACSAVIVALIVSFSAIYFVFKGPRSAN